MLQLPLPEVADRPRPTPPTPDSAQSSTTTTPADFGTAKGDREVDERGAGGKARRHTCKPCRVLHDLVTWLYHYRHRRIDTSPEVLIAAQRIIETYSDGSALHIAASLMIATKMVSVQYSECCATRTYANMGWPRHKTPLWHALCVCIAGLLPCSLVALCIGARPSEVREAELDLCRAAQWRFLPLCRAAVHK